MECAQSALKIFDATPPCGEFISKLALKIKNCNAHAAQYSIAKLQTKALRLLKRSVCKTYQMKRVL